MKALEGLGTVLEFLLRKTILTILARKTHHSEHRSGLFLFGLLLHWLTR